MAARIANVIWVGHHYEVRDSRGRVLGYFDDERDAREWALNKHYRVLSGVQFPRDRRVYFDSGKREYEGWR